MWIALGVLVGLLAAHVYGRPSTKIKLWGVTGTSGKTTTTFTRQNGSLPVQDDFVAWLPDGRLLVLHRRTKLFEGITAKLAIAAIPESGALIVPEEIALLREGEEQVLEQQWAVRSGSASSQNIESDAMRSLPVRRPMRLASSVRTTVSRRCAGSTSRGFATTCATHEFS